MNKELLTIQKARIGAADTALLGPLDLSLAAGEALALFGPNGAGKSTLLRAIMGLEALDAGKIIFDGEQVKGGDPGRMARAGAGYVPEGRRVFPGLTARENMLAASDDPRAMRQTRLEEMLALFPPLTGRLKAEAWRLSGGEQQILAIARALMRRPTLLLLDEPSLGLAPNTASGLFEALKAVRQSGVAILIAEQNAAAASRLASRAAVLVSGKIVAEGPAPEIAEPNSLALAYLR
jgi:branched-chain amino acid transport system ATP-binding protein